MCEHVTDRLNTYQPLFARECFSRSACTSLGDYSLLVIIWWQPRFALPIEPAIVSRIAKVDWENSAWDGVD